MAMKSHMVFGILKNLQEEMGPHSYNPEEQITLIPWCAEKWAWEHQMNFLPMPALT